MAMRVLYAKLDNLVDKKMTTVTFTTGC